MSGILNDIPNGMCRVVEILLETGTDASLGDFLPEEAVSMADQHNSARVGLLDSVRWVYDDTGDRIRTHESV